MAKSRQTRRWSLSLKLGATRTAAAPPDGSSREEWRWLGSYIGTSGLFLLAGAIAAVVVGAWLPAALFGVVGGYGLWYAYDRQR
jgi:hypothetical protein